MQAPLYWDIYVPLGLDSARLAFTCHNFEYQGADNSAAIASCGLSPRELMRPDRMQDNSYPNKINLLKVIPYLLTSSVSLYVVVLSFVQSLTPFRVVSITVYFSYCEAYIF